MNIVFNIFMYELNCKVIFKFWYKVPQKMFKGALQLKKKLETTELDYILVKNSGEISDRLQSYPGRSMFDLT